jgi:opacity protein-like surface antigen
MRRFVAATVVASALALSAPAAQAQESPGTWRHTVFLYGMGAAIDGNSTIGNLTLPVDVSMSDLFDALKFGAMAAYRMENDEWSFEGDATYMNLGFNQRGSAGRVGGELSTEQFTLMATAGKRLNQNLEALVSLAYFDLTTELEVQVLQQRRSASRNASWVDPLVGLHYTWPFAGKWTYSLRGDIGGFGVGSDLTWQVLTAFRRQNTERFGWFVGYRVISFDYSSGSGSNYQRQDLTQQGPMLGVNFSF